MHVCVHEGVCVYAANVRLRVWRVWGGLRWMCVASLFYAMIFYDKCIMRGRSFLCVCESVWFFFGGGDGVLCVLLRV